MRGGGRQLFNAHYSMFVGKSYSEISDAHFRSGDILATLSSARGYPFFRAHPGSGVIRLSDVVVVIFPDPPRDHRLHTTAPPAPGQETGGPGGDTCPQSPARRSG